MNDTTQLVTKGERHCGTNLLTEVLKLTFGAAACPGSGRFVGSGRTCGFEAARAYEAAERWRERLSDDDLAFINGELDAGLMAYFGFDFVNGSSAAARRPPRRHASAQLALLPTAAAPRLDAAEHRRILSFLS